MIHFNSIRFNKTFFIQSFFRKYFVLRITPKKDFITSTDVLVKKLLNGIENFSLFMVI